MPFATVPQTGSANTLSCWFGNGDPPNINDDIWQVVVRKDGNPNDAGPPLFSIKFNVNDQMLEMNVYGGRNTDWCNVLIDKVRISDEALQPSQLLGVVSEPGIIISGIILDLLTFRRK